MFENIIKAVARQREPRASHLSIDSKFTFSDAWSESEKQTLKKYGAQLISEMPMHILSAFMDDAKDSNSDIPAIHEYLMERHPRAVYLIMGIDAGHTSSLIYYFRHKKYVVSWVE